MESFWTAETLKYYYLIFSEPTLVSLDEYVLCVLSSMHNILNCADMTYQQYGGASFQKTIIMETTCMDGVG